MSENDEKNIEQSVFVKGVRKNCFSGEERTISCVLTLTSTPKFGKIVHITRGGVTGWEYFGVDQKIKRDTFQSGRTACSGTPGEWDKLFIPGDEMTRALEELGLFSNG
jgi:hypothetical protein